MTQAAPRVFDVATYNIHYAIGTDRHFAPVRVAEIVLALGAEIVALQEVGWHYRGRSGVDQFDLLRKMTGLEVHAGFTRNHARARFGNAVLTRWPARQVAALDLSVRFRAPRGALAVDLDWGGTVLRIVNVHLGLDPFERRIQVGRLLGLLAAKPAAPTLLLGDFNEWRRRPAYLEDVARLLPGIGAPPSFHARRPVFPFDRIYASHHFEIAHARAVHSPLTKKASDHLPVVGRVVWHG